jgi:hypothetical protein
MKNRRDSDGRKVRKRERKTKKEKYQKRVAQKKDEK